MQRILTGCLLCLAAIGAYGADDDTAKGASAAQMFVTKATQEGLTEVEMGKLAQSRSSDAAVQAFAARMVADHTQANAELAAIAKREGFNVPTQLDGEHATILHAVGTKPASEFAAEYRKRMMAAHDAAVTLFSDASAIGDKEIAAFAQKTLPTLHEHQQLATTLPGKRATSAGTVTGSDVPADIPPAQ
jgi:putative membrane protein